MHDYTATVGNNLSIYRGIVDNLDRVMAINALMNELDVAGFHTLVQNFCTNWRPERARDFLFEMWVCKLLHRDDRVRNLLYEPNDDPNPPDFRFSIDLVTFDVQLKRLTNIENEITKRQFQRQCREQLGNVQKNWLIHYWLSEQLKPAHWNDFFAYVKRSINTFQPIPVETLSRVDKYSWPEGEEALIRFSFSEAAASTHGIIPGNIHQFGTGTGIGRRVPIEDIRKKLEKNILEKSSKSLVRQPSATHINLVMVEVDDDILMNMDIMADALYGDKEIVSNVTGKELKRKANGLFRIGTSKFTRIGGLILVAENATPFDNTFSGVLFPNPGHIQAIREQPEAFPGLNVYIDLSIGKVDECDGTITLYRGIRRTQ